MTVFLWSRSVTKPEKYLVGNQLALVQTLPLPRAVPRLMSRRMSPVEICGRP